MKRNFILSSHPDLLNWKKFWEILHPIWLSRQSSNTSLRCTRYVLNKIEILHTTTGYVFFRKEGDVEVTFLSLSLFLHIMNLVFGTTITRIHTLLMNKKFNKNTYKI